MSGAYATLAAMYVSAAQTDKREAPIHPGQRRDGRAPPAIYFEKGADKPINDIKPPGERPWSWPAFRTSRLLCWEAHLRDPSSRGGHIQKTFRKSWITLT